MKGTKSFPVSYLIMSSDQISVSTAMITKFERSGVTSALTLHEFLFCKIKRQSVFQRQRDINSNNISVHL